MSKKYILVLALFLVVIAGVFYYFWSKQQPGKKSLPLMVIFGFLAIALIAGFSFYSSQKTTDSHASDTTDCGGDYDCLYKKILAGNSAKITLSETIETLLLKEKSEIKIEPKDNQFRVSMTILELKKLEPEASKTKPASHPIWESCPQIMENLPAIEGTSVSCITNTAEEARDLAVNGLSDEAINKYSCKGSLIDKIKKICPNSSNFPSIKKPAIYLYPLEKSEINVALDLKGTITKSEPAYTKGWKINAEPSGLIDGKYDYLFYEAQLEDLKLPEEGWVVKYEKMEDWFDSNLKKLGLNEKEISQFKEYWLAELPFANYYEIKLLAENFLSDNMNLIIVPKPTTIIRRNFVFKPLNSQILLKEPDVITPTRLGFTVVEWGGLLTK